MAFAVSLVVCAVLAFGGVVSLGVGYIAYQHRDHPAAKPLAKIAMFSGFAGLIYGALTFVRVPLAIRTLHAGAQAFITMTPAYFLIFVLIYTGRAEWLTRRRRGAIIGGYVVLALIQASAIVTTTVSVPTENGLTYPAFARQEIIGIILVIVAVAYVTTLIAYGLLGQFLISPRNTYRKQTLVLLGALVVPVIANVVYEFGFSPHPGLNLTSVFFTWEAGGMALALFRYEFLNIQPLAPEIVLEEMDDPVLVLDDSETVVDANVAALELFEEDDPTGVTVADALPWLAPALGSTEETVRADARSDGDISHLYDVSEAPIQDQYDRARGTVVVLRDITRQKDRERTFEGLQSISQRFLTAESKTEVLDIAVKSADEVLDYQYSGAMIYDEDEELLRPASFTDHLEAAFAEQELTANPTVGPGESDVWQVFESGEVRLGDPIEATDNEIPVDLGGSLLFPLGDHGVLGISAGPDHDGFSEDERRFVSILATTTENALDRVEQERKLRESRELLATRKDQLEFFNSVLRHDMLNGMQVVRGHTEHLQRQIDGEPSEHVDTIDEWITDITDLTQKVRTITKSITDDDGIDQERVDLGAVLTDRVEKMRASHDTATIDIESDLEDLPDVWADDLLPELFENVIGNAIEHTDTEPEVSITTTHTDETITVRIADNGPGIDDEMKERIFHEHVSPSTSGSMGFGLYFVHVMMDLYGGDVWFEDNDPQGAIAVLQFPVATASTRTTITWD